MIKIPSFLVVYFLVFGLFGQTFFEKADLFFKEYVKEGNVNYRKIKEEPQMLNDLYEKVGSYKWEETGENERKAFLINAYNLLVIRQVADRYPIEGPLKVEGFFDGIRHRVGGKMVTLDELEKQLLFRQFPDPRLHFVLVCAAEGCPPLASFAYQPEGLDEQIEKRTRYILNLDSFVRVNNKKAELSKIFEWYHSDFLKKGTSIVEYINQFRDRKIPLNLEVSYYEYDWSLNEWIH